MTLDTYSDRFDDELDAVAHRLHGVAFSSAAKCGRTRPGTMKRRLCDSRRSQCL